MSTRFQVFLPPTLTPLEECKTHPAHRLVFHDLPRSARGVGASQSLIRRHLQSSIQLNRAAEDSDIRLPTLPTVPDAHVPDHTDANVQREAAVAASSARKRKTSIERNVSADIEAKSIAHSRRALGPRRSARFTRPSEGFLTTLPGLDNTESFLSLNTTATISQLSQPPLPNWSIPLSKLVSLHALLHPTSASKAIRRTAHADDSAKISLMICVMAVETPVRRQRKEEKARGQEGTLWIGDWKVTVPPSEAPDGAGKAQKIGEEREVGCAVKLWEGMAREWGDARIRRGDVVLLENVTFKAATAKDPASIIISPSPSGIQPRITVLYRTLPRKSTRKADYLPLRAALGPRKDFTVAESAVGISPEDAALRPDLRLGRSDAGVKRVAEWARWFAEWVGGEPP